MMLLIASLIAGGGLQSEVRVIARQEQTYRLLYSDNVNLSDGTRKVGYVISVDGLLARSDIERVICNLLLKEKPQGFSILAISLYHRLDEYIPPLGAPGLEAKLLGHDLAYYRWNSSLKDRRDRLLIVRDIEGRVLVQPQGHDFNHEESCAPTKR
jgi:hypothetical protein